MRKFFVLSTFLLALVAGGAARPGGRKIPNSPAHVAVTAKQMKMLVSKLGIQRGAAEQLLEQIDHEFRLKSRNPAAGAKLSVTKERAGYASGVLKIASTAYEFELEGRQGVWQLTSLKRGLVSCAR